MPQPLKPLQKQLSSIKPGNFFIVAIISAIVCLFGLRANNEHMVKLRNAVYTADQNNGNVTLSLQNLQAYVTRHMNTNLSTGNGSIYPPIQLKYTYQRLLANESAIAASNNSSLYTQAQNYCQGAIPTGFSGRYRVPCIEQYVENHDTNLPTVPDALYKFNFVSPTWSPDLAGWTMMLAIVSVLLGLIYLLFNRLA